jgi:hypothetical protein
MSWGGFGSYSGSGSSVYANRGGPFTSSYSRGGGIARGRGYGRAGFGMSYGGGGAGINSSSSGSSNVDGSSRGSGTARVAVVGATQGAFNSWWAIHTAGFQVSVVVGVDDARSNGVTTKTNAYEAAIADAAPVVSDEERKSSAEAARLFALRCVQYYHLPRRTTSTTTTATVDGSSQTPSVDSAVSPVSGGNKEDVAEVRVRVSDPATKEEMATTTATASAASSAPIAVPLSSSAATVKDSSTQPCITATAWTYFLKPYFDSLKSAEEESGKPGGGASAASASPSPAGGAASSYWSMRSIRAAGKASDSATSSTTATTPLVDEVEIIYVASLKPRSHDSDEISSDETHVRAALVWLLGKGKHLVVDCVLSSETLAACAAAASTVMHGKASMQRVFLYRGGGVRYGWSPAAMAQLRMALAVRRGTGEASATKPSLTSAADTTAVSKATSTATATATATAAKPTSPPVDDAFSIFDFMGAVGEGSSPFSGTLKEAESNVPTTTTTTSVIAAKDSKEANVAAEHEAATQVITSIALDGEKGVVGNLQQLRFTVRGCGIGCDGNDGMPCAPALGVMDALGWDAVAWVLHLMDWTCPDMVQGRVVRRHATAPHAPLCVEAALYYGVDGTANEENDDDASQDKGASDGSEHNDRKPHIARPKYVRILLHISVIGNGDDVAAAGPSVFQQSVRIVGTTAVVTVPYPLLPPPSQTSITATSAASTPPPAAAATPSASSPFQVTSTRTVGMGAPVSAATSVAAAAAAEVTTATMPATPAVTYSYVVATQDVSPDSFQRMRKEKGVLLSSTDGEPCAEARVWQHVRAQLSVTTLTTMSTSPSLGVGVGSAGGYQPYGSRYATRGRYGANIGRGGVSRGYYGRGRGGVGTSSAAGVGALSSATELQTVVKAELTSSEAAALDVQRAWLVQMVVERILASAAIS